jgi:8-oxo-dGTP pyrophosphatase MutT (NUDIX family)
MSSTPSRIDAIASACDLPARLKHVLSGYFPDRAHTRHFAPEMSYGRHYGPAPATARQAAVVLLLFRRGGTWHVPLTERPATLTRHGGQISLPGGTLEIGESSQQAALRELDEELGIREGVDLFGCLSDCYVFASDYVVKPWLAVMHSEPVWRPRVEEVHHVIELPVASLLDGKHVGRMTIERGPVVFHAPCYLYDDHSIWGATSVVLSELAHLLAMP